MFHLQVKECLLCTILLYLRFLRFEDSAVFETPPLGRIMMPGKGRRASMKREMADPFEGLEKYGINTGNDPDENCISKRKRYIPDNQISLYILVIGIESCIPHKSVY